MSNYSSLTAEELEKKSRMPDRQQAKIMDSILRLLWSQEAINRNPNFRRDMLKLLEQLDRRMRGL